MRAPAAPQRGQLAASSSPRALHIDDHVQHEERHVGHRAEDRRDEEPERADLVSRIASVTWLARSFFARRRTLSICDERRDVVRYVQMTTPMKPVSAVTFK